MNLKHRFKNPVPIGELAKIYFTMSVKQEETEIQRAYYTALSDLDFYEETAAEHQKNLDYSNKRIGQTNDFIITIKERAKELGIKLIEP